MSRKRIVKLDEKSFVEPLYLSKYAAMAQEFGGMYPALPINEVYLSQINYQIQLFMENELGASSSKPSGLVKLPARLFNRDFKINSAIFLILREAIDLMIRLDWTSFDLSPAERKSYGISLIQKLHKSLSEKKLISYPCIYFGNFPHNEASDFREIVLRRMGSISLTEDDATHIIEWSKEISGANDSTDEYARIVDARADGSVLLHYCYYPDSYDEWVQQSPSATETDLTLDTQENSKKKKWKLISKFIKDVDLYNEWGNEIDYEIEEFTELGMTASIESSSQPNKRFKLMLGSSQSTETVQQILEASFASERCFSEVAPPSKAQKAVIYDAGVDASQSSLSIQSISTSKRKADGSNDVERKAARFARSDGLSIETNSIGPTEMRYLSELFISPKFSINDYITLRNQIISIYRLNPTVYLSATDCRQKLSGDVSVVLLVHEFLDFFGVINGDVKPECKPATNLSLSMSLNPELMKSISSIRENLLSTHDRELIVLVSKYGNDWNKISSELRLSHVMMSASQCFQRFASLANPKHVNLVEDSGVTMKEQFFNNDTRIQLMINDYMDGRISALENKAQLVTTIQNILNDERERLEIERRDLAIQRAQLSLANSSQLGKS